MATTDHSQPHAYGNGQVLNHETTDVSLKGVTRIAILSFAIILAILGVMFGIFKAFEAWATDRRPVPAISAVKPGQDRIPVGPLLQTDEPGGLRQLRTQERQLLEHYGWVDKSQGVVRVPIERAMEIVAEHPERLAPLGGAAAPAAPAAQPAPATPPAAGH
jgi:hypothetical protein